ncbi:flagellar basal-body rod protein FlgG [Photobacterium leiognathi]|uniref:flagellar basal-body rod protein FlgG n=1 Tax=Photobacterium leiognathi TaxID=553611 RepID=UPI001EE070B2|nr:flagellar basal-body rod protein FlgG [Photobacterium leiognathi]MCG3883682.1 flagellar basal-body rod protein FlgG [Photobacterium leiognathi]
MSIAALHIAQTGLSGQERQLSAISNNIANAGTKGYKVERTEFASLMYQTLREAEESEGGSVLGVSSGTGVQIAGISRDFSQGTVNMTNRELDVMISANGLLKVTKSDGQEYYTRNGQLKVDHEGRLVTNLNQPIEPEISIPSDTTEISIGRDGTISVKTTGSSEAQDIGKIELAKFINPESLKPVGDNLFAANESSGEAILGEPATEGFGELMQYALEGSNVNTVEELIKLIAVQRTYELNSKVIKGADDMLSFASQKIGN